MGDPAEENDPPPESSTFFTIVSRKSISKSEKCTPPEGSLGDLPYGRYRPLTLPLVPPRKKPMSATLQLRAQALIL